MSFKSFFSFMCLVFAVSFCTVSAKTCGDSLHFTPKGTYDQNRRLILVTLVTNFRAGYGFYNGSIGQGTGKIYALGLCIPGTDQKICTDCIRSASTDLLENCPNQTDSFDWRGDSWKGDKTICFVRYSNRSFYDSIDLEPNEIQYSNDDITGNITEFNIIWEEFMERMIVATSSSTPRSPTGMYFKADMTPWTRFLNIYVLMLCIPGISSKDCDICLRANVRRFQQCCNGKQGAGIERPTCYFRWDIFAYFGLFDNITHSPPPQSIEDPQVPLGPQSMPPPPHLPNATKRDAKSISKGPLITVLVVAAIMVALFSIGFVFYRRRKSTKTTKLKIDDDITSPQSLQFDFKTLEDATGKFSRKNKIGQGGFGEVYKGTFPNGTEIAVKRLSRNSGQGLKEFTNEVVVVAKLQHRNLVKILGFCLEGEEKILVYEFVSNKSLDYFLFDKMKQYQLDWSKRYNIIGGIARGILYLHQDSRLTIIHRDLKASNILLDDEMNPKIADFGMARIFGMEQTRADTSKIAGTFGYMAPEYFMHGQFSMKSDVYSFGVLVLEIICGISNSSFYQINESTGNLVTHAWRLWRKGLALELLDPTFRENYQRDEVTRCIHIALLCVQEHPTDRPILATIILMLTSSSITLPVPNEPMIFLSEQEMQS